MLPFKLGKNSFRLCLKFTVADSEFNFRDFRSGLFFKAKVIQCSRLSTTESCCDLPKNGQIMMSMMIDDFKSIY